MGVVWKIVAALVGGLIFAILGFMVVTMSLGGSLGDSTGGLVMVGLFITACVITWKASSPAKAWRRLLISCGILSLAMPIAALLFSGSLMASGPQGDAAYAAGSAIGYGVATALTGFISIFMAAIFLITGLLIGRDKPAS